MLNEKLINRYNTVKTFRKSNLFVLQSEQNKKRVSANNEVQQNTAYPNSHETALN